jgi:hypothetical protein
MYASFCSPETSSKLFWKSDLNVDTWKFLCQTALTTKQLPVIRQMWGDHGRSYLGRSRNSRVSVSSRLAAKQEVPQSSIQSPVVLHMLMCFSLLFIAFHCFSLPFDVFCLSSNAMTHPHHVPTQCPKACDSKVFSRSSKASEHRQLDSGEKQNHR